MKRETGVFAEKDMKTQNEKKRFIELRAKGLSYDKISKELEISKPTLIKWNDELKNEIANLRYFEFESIIAEYSLSKRSRLESFSIILSKALEELKEKCERLGFFPLSYLPSNIVDYNEMALRHILEGKFYSKLGWKE